MSIEIRRAEPVSAKSLARRFWGLVAMVLVLAVVSSALAVRHSATPYLAHQQREVITEQARKDARDLENLLTRHRQLLSFVAGQADVVSVVLGYDDNADIVSDYLETLPRPDELEWLGLFDIFGGELARKDVAENAHSQFGKSFIAELVDILRTEAEGVERKVGYVRKDGKAHVLLAVPVQHMGFTEGVLMAEFEFDQLAFLPRSEVARRTFVTLTGDGGETVDPVPDGATVVAVPNFDLAIVLEPDLAVVASAGRELLTNTVSAISLVLTVAMALFAWAGGRLIVRPHHQLEMQKAELAELAAVAERSTDSILVTDLDGLTVWANPAFEKLSGFSARYMRGRKPGELLQGPETDPDVVARISDALRTRQPIETEIMNYTPGGATYWIRISIAPLESETTGEPYGFMAISHDVTQMRKQREAIIAAKLEIEQQALHDPLTGLPNRRALDLALAERQSSAGPDATLVRIDLDHFKYVNDTMGHAAGDHVLQEVARILRDETKADDLPVRVGGDEFVLLLAPGNTSRTGRALAERMLLRIREPIEFEGKTIRFGASFGVASTTDGILPIDELTIGADSALYEAKEQGRNTVRLYTPELHSRVLDRRSLARELRRAIANEEFEPYFQPQFDARTRKLVGVETLVRWHSPELGLVMPNTFLPVVEQLSAVNDIDAIIFRKAIRYIKGLVDEGIDIPKLSFNVTAERIQNPKLAETLLDLAGSGPRLAFEILESVLVEEQSELFGLSLDRLRDLGVSIEIDDFGSGHASIVGLMHLQPDVMKIDQRLILPITRCQTTRGLVQQIVGMASLMGLKVTAEGVETMEHAEILQDLGCDTFQGFAFAHAMTVEGLRKFAATYRPASVRAADPG